jgi:hypothetical protein
MASSWICNRFPGHFSLSPLCTTLRKGQMTQEDRLRHICRHHMQSCNFQCLTCTESFSSEDYPPLQHVGLSHLIANLLPGRHHSSHFHTGLQLFSACQRVLWRGAVCHRGRCKIFLGEHNGVEGSSSTAVEGTGSFSQRRNSFVSMFKQLRNLIMRERVWS